jgi:excisionase family DNA binding protein
MKPLSISIDEARRQTGIGRTRIFAEIKAGNLRAHKIGRRTVIILDDLHAWLQSSPVRSVTVSAQDLEAHRRRLE